MKVLIFNSGQGTRMQETTKRQPKCMTDIGESFTIISWQLHMLKCIEPDEVIITTGPFAEELKNHIALLDHGLNIRYVHNPLFKDTNYIYSFYCAREFLTSDVIIMHGDLVFEKSVIDQIAEADTSVVVIDSQAEISRKDFTAITDGKRVTKIGVDLSGEQMISCQPMYKIIKKDLELWLQEVENYCIKLNKRKVYAEDAFNDKSDSIALYTTDIKGRLCQEIDDLSDLANTKNRFLKYLKER